MKYAILLGYITAANAKRIGFTHSASYYGLPMWIRQHGDGFTGTAKWRPADRLIPIMIEIEQFMRGILFPGEEPVFQFRIGEAL